MRRLDCTNAGASETCLRTSLVVCGEALSCDGPCGQFIKTPACICSFPGTALGCCRRSAAVHKRKHGRIIHHHHRVFFAGYVNTTKCQCRAAAPICNLAEICLLLFGRLLVRTTLSRNRPIRRRASSSGCYYSCARGCSRSRQGSRSVLRCLPRPRMGRPLFCLLCALKVSRD